LLTLVEGKNQDRLHHQMKMELDIGEPFVFHVLQRLGETSPTWDVANLLLHNWKFLHTQLA
jgi:hypothetical protein